MSYELFDQELSVLQAAKARLQRAGDGGDLGEDFRNLLLEYEKLFKQVRRLVRISDRTEAELRDTQLDLRKRTNLMELMHGVVESANTAHDPRDAMRRCLNDVCTFLGAQFGQAWMVAPDHGGHLVPAEIWPPRDDQQFADLRRERAPATVAAGDGVVGRCFAAGKVQWTSDLANEPAVAQARARTCNDLASAIAVPVIVDQQVVAVLEFLLTGSTKPEATVLRALENLGLQIGRVFERDQAAIEITDARDAAEAAARAKASFLAAMSHEIRTPMNGVIGMVDLLAHSRLDADQQHMVRTIRNSAQSLLTIINDILDFSKIEAGKLDIERLPISIGQIVEEVADTLVPLAADKAIRIVSYVDPTVPVRLMGDAVRIRQILLNLGSNAVKFTSNEDGAPGKVVIRADPARAPDSESVAVRLSVADTGIGMSRDAVAKLFEPFVQAESSTSRRFGGTGLGLSICRQLTDLMSGEITVQSVLGEGSVFTVTLPADVAPGDAGEEPATAGRLSGVRVLAMLDEPETGAFIERYLAHWRADGRILSGSDSAKGSIRDVLPAEKAYDMVLLDHANAQEFVAELTATTANGENPVIPGLVVLSSDRTAPKAYSHQGVMFVGKDPLHPSALLRAIEVVTGRAEVEVDDNRVRTIGSTVRTPSVAEAERRGELILVAEDNPTNRDVIRRQLDLLGYAADIAGDGAAALDAWHAKRYAMLLTDCHMPRMDGFELTAAIRQSERDARLPIVAITANALEGEAEQCLAAGMDDFLTKPLEMEKLRAVLAKWVPKSAPGAATDGSMPIAVDRSADPADPQSPRSDVPVDVTALTDLFGDDPGVVREILRDFVAPSQAIVAEFESALASRTAAGIVAAAHKLKSSSWAVGAAELADVCERLESAGKSENWAAIDTLGPRLNSLMAAVTAFIERL